ncbi:MAG TPA: aldo/keto reductase [Rhizomicrobium sp.]|nr:aldo/keto reductase [Rhizomicrobium sp.]
MRAALAQAPLLARAIPHGNGETLPAVGTGSAIIFDVGSDQAARARLTQVVQTLVAGGGKLIDTAPSYGTAESVIGDIVAAAGLRPKLFLSTKLERYPKGGMAAEAKECLARLKTGKLDLLHLHNVRDPNQDLGELNALKEEGVIRYTGITTTFEASYDAAEAILKRTKPDFLEIDYAIDNREAEKRLLPAARDAGSAVLTALPFGRGRLFRTALGKPLPDFAADIDCKSWAQFFLKFNLSHPAVTAVIPGTDKPEYMTDNLGAARGRLPDAAMRERMAKYVETMR